MVCFPKRFISFTGNAELLRERKIQIQTFHLLADSPASYSGQDWVRPMPVPESRSFLWVFPRGCRGPSIEPSCAAFSGALPGNCIVSGPVKMRTGSHIRSRHRRWWLHLFCPSAISPSPIFWSNHQVVEISVDELSCSKQRVQLIYMLMSLILFG